MKEGKYTVYAHKNKSNGKMYVGITCQSLIDRWKNGKGYIKTSHMGRAIEKYGWDGFDHFVIIEGLTVEQAKETEKVLISMLDLTNPQNGYNEAVGGGGGGMYGKHHSEDAKRKISEARKKDGFTEEHKRHISESKKGAKHHMAKVVYQYSKEGVLLGEWPYMNMAAESLNIKKESISACCMGRRPSAGGFVWSYERKGVVL